MDFTILITAELVVVGMLPNSKLIFTVVVSYNQLMFIFKFKQISSDNFAMGDQLILCDHWLRRIGILVFSAGRTT